MKKLKISNSVKIAKKSIVKHSPEILTGLGIVGMLSSTIMAVKATPKAMKLIEAEQQRTEELTKTDMIKVAWKPYIPTIITGTVSIVCIVGASTIHAQRNAALTAAYALSETALSDYRKSVIETIGDKKEQVIREKVAENTMKKHPVESKEVFLTGKGETLCFDYVSGRYFKSDHDKLRKVENELNRRMRDEMYISLNDFYYEIGLPNIPLGDDLGWNIDDGYIDLRLSSKLATDGTPCLVVDYGYGPRYDYRKLL